MNTKTGTFRQVGFTAQRNIDGTAMDPVPLWIEESEAARASEDGMFAALEQILLRMYKDRQGEASA